MSRQRRNFSAKFKSNLVIELLKGELNNLGLIPGQRVNVKPRALDN